MWYTSLYASLPNLSVWYTLYASPYHPFHCWSVLQPRPVYTRITGRITVTLCPFWQERRRIKDGYYPFWQERAGQGARRRGSRESLRPVSLLGNVEIMLNFSSFCPFLTKSGGLGGQEWASQTLRFIRNVVISARFWPFYAPFLPKPALNQGVGLPPAFPVRSSTLRLREPGCGIFTRFTV